MSDTAEATIREYYGALRAGEPIHPFFADAGPIVKVGIGDRMVGAGAVAEGLREQTRTTTGWVVESRDLHVGTVGPDAGSNDIVDDPETAFAWFGDEVFMGWTDTERNIRFEFDTRWSGAMARTGGSSRPSEANGTDGSDREEGASGRAWRFVEMHVSTPGET